MHSVSVSCSTLNLDNVFSDFFDPATENFKLLRWRFDAAEVILRNVFVISIACRERNAINLGPGRWEDSILSNVDTSWESSPNILVGGLAKDIFHVRDKSWAGGSEFIIFVILILDRSVLVASIVMLVDQSFELVLIPFIIGKELNKSIWLPVSVGYLIFDGINFSLNVPGVFSTIIFLLSVAILNLLVEFVDGISAVSWFFLVTINNILVEFYLVIALVDSFVAVGKTILMFISSSSALLFFIL